MTKLTKPSIPVNLVGPQVSLPVCWVPAGRGSIHFFVRNKEELPAGPTCQRGACYFREIQRPFWWVPDVRWRNHYFLRNKEALPCCGGGPSCQPLHVQSTSDGSRSLTMLTTPRREHHDGGRWRGLGRGRLGAVEDAALDAHAKRSTRVHWFGCSVRLLSPQNNRGCG